MKIRMYMFHKPYEQILDIVWTVYVCVRYGYEMMDNIDSSEYRMDIV